MSGRSLPTRREELDRILPGTLARERGSIVQELRSELQALRPPPADEGASSESTSSSTPSPTVPASPVIKALEPPGPAQPELESAPAPPEVPRKPPLGEHVSSPSQISNSKRRRRHLIRVGPPHADPSVWEAACRWKFGRSRFAVPADPTHKPCALCMAKSGGALQ